MIKTGITRRQFSTGLAGSAAITGICPPFARAQQGYPNRPVRFILPFGAAGVADITSRLAAEKLGDKLGQRFVVENQPGPGGIAAARSVLSQPPDGYTLGLVTNGTSISAAIYKALPFDPVKSFATISTIGSFDLVFATNAESEFKTLQDFIKAAREQPGKLNVGTINVGGTQNLAAELFKSLAGLNFQIVPYRGTPDVIEQIKHQLERLIPVHRVRDLTVEGVALERELALIKVAGKGEKRIEALRIAEIFRAKVVDTSTEHFVFEVTGKPSKLEEFIQIMTELGLVEVSRTGIAAIGLGPSSV